MLNKISTYMAVASEVAKLSPDDETQVGAVLISPNGSIVATGYNGFVRGAHDRLLPKTRPHKYLYMQHAERNLLYNCLNEGISTKDSTLVCTLSPCLDCLRALFQSGVKTIVFDKLHRSQRLSDYDILDIRVDVDLLGNYTVLTLSDGASIPEYTIKNRLEKIKKSLT